MVGLKAHSLCTLLFLRLVFFGQLALLLRPSWAKDVTLAWDANSESDLSGYKIYYGRNPGGPYNGSGSTDGASPVVVPLSSLLNPASPEFTLRDLTGNTYCFVATAYDTEGYESLYGNEACTSLPKPISFYILELLLLDDD